MSVTEVIGGLGSWRLVLSPETPQHVRDALDFFGHVAIVAGPVDVEASGDGLLAGAKYVGVVRELPEPGETGQQLAGSGMAFWLGDEDGKGYVLEGELDLSGKTLAQAVPLILNPVDSVTIGTIHPGAVGTLPANTKFLYVSPRQVLQDVCDAFGREYRVNGNGSVDIGTQAQLYQGSPTAVVWRESSGSDTDLIALAGQFDVDATVYDWTSRVLMVGSRRVGEGEEATDELFVSAASDIADNPFLDLFGNPVKATRVVSDSTVNAEGTAQARADLNRNRFARVARSFQLTSSDYDTEGSFRVGDMLFVYDPDTGIVDPAVERVMSGRVIHPEAIRLVEATWTVKPGYTVAYRSGAGSWVDLTPFVTAETGRVNDVLTVGDLPRSLSRPGGSDPLQDRIDSARPDTTIPGPPTGLVLSTDAYVAASGATLAFITAEWVKPLTNTNGTAYTDHSHYLVQSRWTGRGWGEGASRTAETDVDLTGLAPALPHEVRVAAVDLGGKVGEWASAFIVTAEDDIAPTTPAAGVLTSFLGQLRLDWPGVNSDGLRMSDDTKTVNVHIGVPGFTVAPDNRIDTLSPFSPGVGIYDWPLGVDVEVKLQAEDHTGNLSSPSEGVVGETAPLGDNEIGTLSVGRLTGGILDAVVIVGQRIVSGSLTGQRTQMEPSGWRAYDDDEDLTVQIDGVSNLLIGELATGKSGDRRVVVGTYTDASNGLTGGAVRLIAEDGTLSLIQSATIGGVETMYMGVPIASSPSWNGFQAQDDQAIFGVSRTVDFIFGGGGTAGSGAFVVETTTNRANARASANRRLRYQIDTVNHLWYAPSGTSRRMQFALGSGSPVTDSPVLFWANDYGFGAGLKFQSSSVGANPGLLVVTPDGTAFSNIYANAFLPPSDEALKDDIVAERGLLGELLAADDPVISYRLKAERRGRVKRRKKDGDDALPGDLGRVHLGLSANRVPARMQVEGPDGMLAYDLGSGLAIALGSIRELAAIVEELRAELAELRGTK